VLAGVRAGVASLITECWSPRRPQHFHRLQDLSERLPQGQQGILWQTVLQEREASLGVLKDAAAVPRQRVRGDG
jgi:hypothetical protein